MKKSIFLCIILLLTCSPYKVYIRVDPNLGNYYNNIDTIAIFCDGLVAIDTKIDHYNMKASYAVDSLVLHGLDYVLQKKGYSTKIISPCLSGSFQNPSTTVPVKSLKNDTIIRMSLPYVFPSNIPKENIDALATLNRHIYLNLIYNKPYHPSSFILNNHIKNALKMTAEFFGHDYACFVFHNAAIIDPKVTLGMMAGTAILTTLLSGGMFIGYATKISIYHTYIVFVNLVTGEIIWSNYEQYDDVAPVSNIINISKSEGDMIVFKTPMDSIYHDVKRKWENRFLSGFPERNSQEFFKGYKKARSYRGQDFFLQNTQETLQSALNFKFRNWIDSVVIVYSLSDSCPGSQNGTSEELLYGEGREYRHIVSDFDTLNNYLQYAFNSRLNFKPLISGKVKCSFVVTHKGQIKNVRIIESTIDDCVLEYITVQLLDKKKFANASEKTGATKLTHEFTFSK